MEHLGPSNLELSRRVLGAAIEVHRALGPGLLESAYRSCLALELRLMDLRVEEEVPVPLQYRGRRIEAGYRLDLLVERELVVELKAVRALEPLHVAQVLTYLRLSGRRVGLLINFNVVLLKEGVRRLVVEPRVGGGSEGEGEGESESESESEGRGLGGRKRGLGCEGS